jgi:hypothetical protein
VTVGGNSLSFAAGESADVLRFHGIQDVACSSENPVGVESASSSANSSMRARGPSRASSTAAAGGTSASVGRTSGG